MSNSSGIKDVLVISNNECLYVFDSNGKQIDLIKPLNSIKGGLKIRENIISYYSDDEKIHFYNKTEQKELPPIPARFFNKNDTEKYEGIDFLLKENKLLVSYCAEKYYLNQMKEHSGESIDELFNIGVIDLKTGKGKRI